MFTTTLSFDMHVLPKLREFLIILRFNELDKSQVSDTYDLEIVDDDVTKTVHDYESHISSEKVHPTLNILAAWI